MSKDYLKKLRQRVLNFVSSTKVENKQDQGCELVAEIGKLLNQSEDLKVMDFVKIELKVKDLLIN